MKFLKQFFICVLGCLLFFYTKSQTKMNTYDSAWKKIDELIQKKGLVKSALAEVEKIYVRAKKEKNEPQLIKAVLYKLSLSDDNDNVQHLVSIEKEIKAAADPVKQILQSAAAEMYWHYFQNNRWKFYDRTNTSNFNKEDIATWTIDDLHQKISELYLGSLQNEKYCAARRFLLVPKSLSRLPNKIYSPAGNASILISTPCSL